jgi:hypothetical protein
VRRGLGTTSIRAPSAPCRSDILRMRRSKKRFLVRFKSCQRSHKAVERLQLHWETRRRFETLSVRARLSRGLVNDFFSSFIAVNKKTNTRLDLVVGRVDEARTRAFGPETSRLWLDAFSSPDIVTCFETFFRPEKLSPSVGSPSRCLNTP